MTNATGNEEARVNEYLQAGFDGLLKEVTANDPELMETVRAAILPIVKAEASIDSVAPAIDRFNASSFGQLAVSSEAGNLHTTLREVVWGRSIFSPQVNIDVKHSERLKDDVIFFAGAPSDLRNSIVAVNGLAAAMRSQSALVKLLLDRLRARQEELETLRQNTIYNQQ